MIEFESKLSIYKTLSANRVLRRLKAFAKDTDGSMTILTLFLVMIVFTAAGFAVDVMRYDRERVKLQYALDRAVLAAADLDQELCPADVVRDYLSKENLDQFIVDGSIIVEPEGCNARDARLYGSRKVEARAEMQVATHFMQWSGVDRLGTTAFSVAEESIGDVEISLVLDVSGSMRGTKISNLKVAASNFVDEMTAKAEDGKLSISIIPYSEQVTVPDFFMNALNTVGSNTQYNCVDFDSGDFSTTVFDAYDIVDNLGNIVRPGTTINQTLHFRDNGGNDYRSTDGLVTSYTCGETQAKTNREMTIMQKNADTLKERIALLEADGWTSIDVGLKWGLTLLDDSTQPLIAQLINQGASIPSEFNTRPGTNRTAESVKVVVLMTDGENTRQHLVNPPYNSGGSGIFWNNDAGQYSVYDEADDRWSWPYVPSTLRFNDGSRWTRYTYQDHAYGATDGPLRFRRYRCTDYRDGRCRQINTGSWFWDTEYGSNPEELTWPEVWESTEKGEVVDLLETVLSNDEVDDFIADSTTELRQANKDPRVDSLCLQAQDEEVIVFTIAYAAPEGVKPMLRRCAVDAGRYYDLENPEDIIGAFDSISATIQNLRLTQ